MGVIECLEARSLFSASVVPHTVVGFYGGSIATQSGAKEVIFKAGEQVTVFVKVVDPGHSYSSPVNLVVTRYTGENTSSPPVPGDYLDASSQLRKNVGLFHFTPTSTGLYQIAVSLPGLPENPQALTGSWSVGASHFVLKPGAPGPIHVFQRTFSTGGPYSGEFVPFRSDKFGNSVPIEWSNRDVETYVEVKPTGTPLQFFRIAAKEDPTAYRRNGEAYGVHLNSGFGLTLIAPQGSPSRLDINIVITGTHHFRGWVEWSPIPA